MGRNLEYGEPLLTIAVKLPKSLYDHVLKTGNMSGYVRALILSDYNRQNKKKPTVEYVPTPPAPQKEHNVDDLLAVKSVEPKEETEEIEQKEVSEG